MSDEADQFLVESVRRGDQRAWRLLIDRYQRRLLAFAASRLASGAEAEDAVQEAFLGFVTSLPHYDASRPLETYLFAILRYKIGEILTRKQRRGELTTGFDIEDDSRGIPEPAVSETPSQVAADRERTRRQGEVLGRILRRLIEELRDRGRLEDVQVVELVFYVGMRNKDVAERLGRDEKTIAGVKFRALARLREFLAEPEAAEAGLLEGEPLSVDATIARVWRQGRLSCLKRSTIGSYLLGVLEEPWRSYTGFHLDVVGCLMCRANAEDLTRGEEDAGGLGLSEQMFQSSVGFLSRR